MDPDAVTVADSGIPVEYRALARFFDDFVDEADHWERRTAPYHALVRSIYTSLVPPGARVLEIGCGRGDLTTSSCPTSSRTRTTYRRSWGPSRRTASSGLG